jgi:type IV fimbrial biogenesis protein FimT
MLMDISLVYRRAKARSSPYASSCLGFTLVEMMMTLVVLVVLLAIAAPNVTQFIVNNRLTSQANGLLADLSRARSEAGVRHSPVSICAAEDATTCAEATTANWESGWLVFVDANADGAIASAADIIRYVAPLEGDTSVVSSSFTNVGYLTFRPFGGFSPQTSGTFKFCVSGYANGREIAVSAIGRPIAKKIDSCS